MPDEVLAGQDGGVPAAQRPPLVSLIHLSLDLMVGLGLFLFALAAWQAWWWWFRRRLLVTAWFLVPAALGGVAAVAAMEAPDGGLDRVAIAGRGERADRGAGGGVRRGGPRGVAPGFALLYYLQQRRMLGNPRTMPT